MNKKEVLEIRKQFTPENCAITRICGCYVDHEKEKKTELKKAFLSLPEEEGFKYFDIQGVRRIRITTRGYADGDIEVRNEIDGEVLAKLHIVYTNVWEDYETEISIPDGVQPLYFTFRGQGNASLKSFALLKEA
jgi:hypothetical protein